MKNTHYPITREYVLLKRAGKADKEHAWLWGGEDSARNWAYLAQ